MSPDAPLRCHCGAVRGVMTDASPATGSRIICYCDDCQAFARYLGRDDIFDAAGATDIFQVSPSQVRITLGLDHVQCVRLSARGLYRWHTDCCKTPIGNTIGGRFPFIGVIHSFIHLEDTGRNTTDVLGVPVGRIFGKFAIGGCPPDVHPKASARVVLRAVRLVLGWVIGGKGQPQAFFDGKTGAPRVTPRVLTVAERAAVTR